MKLSYHIPITLNSPLYAYELDFEWLFVLVVLRMILFLMTKCHSWDPLSWLLSSLRSEVYVYPPTANNDVSDSLIQLTWNKTFSLDVIVWVSNEMNLYQLIKWDICTEGFVWA